MNIHAEIKLAEEVTRNAITWCGKHADHLAGIAETVGSGPVGHALIEAADALLPEDEQVIARVISALAAIRRHPETASITDALAAPQEAAESPAPVAEGDDPAPDGDGAPVTAQDAPVTA